MAGWLLWPREHGAWGLLLQPFACAAILGRRWDWLYLPALTLVLTAFLMREPLLVLARQKWKWQVAKSESEAARRCLVWQMPLSAAVFALCLKFLPTVPMVTLAGVAAAITVVAVWMTLHNLQRSVVLQVVSSAGLVTTGLLATLVGARGLPSWSWLLCGLLGLHAIASILVVRARLELRAGSRAQAGGPVSRWAWAFQAALAGVAISLFVWSAPGLGAAVGFSAVVSAVELWRIRSRETLAEPLRKVGFRALRMSLAHSALSVAVLW